MEGKKTLDFRYIFDFTDGVRKEFTVLLDSSTLSLVNSEKRSLPPWTQLEFHQCPHCPLLPKEHEFCPIAANMTDLIDFFKDIISYEKARVTIETRERSYFKETAVQNGVSSLIGIYMVTSGCPVMEKLRPMVNFHLPFATVDESAYRSISMYLVEQYFVYKRGGAPDWDLKQLKKRYDDIHLLNKSFKARLDYVCSCDANLNAIVILDMFATFLGFNLSTGVLRDVEKFFADPVKAVIQGANEVPEE